MSSNQTVPEYSLPSSKEELEGVKVLKDDVLGTLSMKETVQVLERWISETGMDRRLISANVCYHEYCTITTQKGFPNIRVKMYEEIDVDVFCRVINNTISGYHIQNNVYVFVTSNNIPLKLTMNRSESSIDYVATEARLQNNLALLLGSIV